MGAALPSLWFARGGVLWYTAAQVMVLTLSRTAPLPCSLLWGGLLALASPLQAAPLPAQVQEAAQALVARGAAVVLLDAHSGEERFAGGALQQALPPGSLFKLVTALAAAEAGTPALDQALRCPTRLRVPPCQHAHGEVRFAQALAVSCNAYFGQLGAALGAARILDTARALGLTQLPAQEDAALLGATGAGVRVTPREVAELVRAIAVGRREGGVPGQAFLPRLRDALALGVQRGTAQGAADRAVPAAGKTGTAVVGAGKVGWFAGYAPASAPTLIVVVARRELRGGEVAGAAAGLLRAYFHGGHGGSAGPGAAPPPAGARRPR